MEHEGDPIVEGMKKYIEYLRGHLTPEEAKAALIRTGVLNEDGSKKDDICNLGMTYL